MPTYEYECNECGYTFEVFQKISADPVETCPKCGGHVHRLIGGGMGVIFKGSGFYTTDYKQAKNNFGGNGKSTGGDNGSDGKNKLEDGNSKDKKKEEKVETVSKKGEAK